MWLWGRALTCAFPDDGGEEKQETPDLEAPWRRWVRAKGGEERALKGVRTEPVAAVEAGQAGNEGQGGEKGA